jgi:hypothetical protein
MAICKSIASGDRFHLLTYLSDAPSGRRRLALFRCDCGTEKVMMVDNVRSGKSKSCGCVGRQKTIERSTKHGHAKRGAHSRAYGSWESMVHRCTISTRPDYHRYGGRGIKVCDRWMDFANFLADMGDPPPDMTLDRFPDVNGNYEPGNCRWATPKEQANNRRSNVYIEFNGKKQNIESWSIELGIPRKLIEGRIHAGVSDPLELFSPPQQIRTIEHQGRSQSIAQWAAELGIKQQTINARLRKGYPIHLALAPNHGNRRPVF